jgi:hypothetical protein
MLGQHGGNQDRLFCTFHLDDLVPSDHLLRGTDRFLDVYCKPPLASITGAK